MASRGKKAAAPGEKLEYLAGGDSMEEVLAEFPDLERADLLACLQ